MSMSAPRWFDENYFIQQKVEQLNLTKYQNRSDWDATAYRESLAEQNLTAYDAFVISNASRNLAETNISPNQLFNVQEYLQALAAYANASGYAYGDYQAGQWTAQKAMEHMFNDYHVSAWDHFTLAGQFDLVNPSNAFDITAYYQSLTNFRNGYVDPDTGIRGWEGRTDWTVLDVVKDNIWDEINPVEGLYGEGGQSGILPVRVPSANQVATDENWNPWVPVISTPDTPTQPDNPSQPDTPQPPSSGGNNSGGSNSGGNTTPPATPDTPNVQEVEINNNEAGTYTGQANVDTIFTAPNGVNPDDVIDGGANSENTLSINLKEDFAGFNGVETEDSDGQIARNPNVTNVQTVELINSVGAGAETPVFHASYMAGVEQWNIKDGPVSLLDIPEADASIAIDNAMSGEMALEYADSVAENYDGKLSVSIALNNAGKNSPLSISSESVQAVTLQGQADNSIDLSGMVNAEYLDATSSGALDIAGLDALSVKAVEFSNGQILMNTSGGASSDDVLKINYSGNGGVNFSGVNDYLTTEPPLTGHQLTVEQLESLSGVDITIAAKKDFQADYIAGKNVIIDASNVEGSVSGSDPATLGFMYVQSGEEARFTGGNGGNDVRVQIAQTASMTGGSGDDQLSAFVTDSAVLNGNGGMDKFVVGAAKQNTGAEQAELITATINGDSPAVKTVDTLVLRVMDMDGAEEDTPLLNNIYGRVAFYYNDKLVSLDFGDVFGPDATYETLASAINEAIANNPDAAGLKASLGEPFTYFNLNHEPLYGTSINITCDNGKLDTSGSGVGLIPTRPLPADSSFDTDMLVTRETQIVCQRLELKLMDIGGAEEDTPLLNNPYGRVAFYYNGKLVSLDFGDVSGADATYETLASAINEAIANNPDAAGLKASLGEPFTYFNLNLEPLYGTSIFITCDNGELDISGSGCGWISTGVAPDSHLSASITPRTDDEQFFIVADEIEHAMAVTINNFDSRDSLVVTDHGTELSFVQIDDADSLMERFFADDTGDYTQIADENGAVYGLFDATTNCAYAFSANLDDEIVVGVKLTGVTDINVAASHLGIDMAA